MANPHPPRNEYNLEPFLSPAFSPVTYLNATFPSASFPTTSLATLASQTQSRISALAAQSARLSATLTTLTDEILRISPRLAYEVELLRGDALSLAESLSPTGDLRPAISQLAPQGLATSPSSSSVPIEPPLVDKERKRALAIPSTASLLQPTQDKPPLAPLRTLLHVRALLTTVSQTFSLALSWPLPPSLLVNASILAVSAPPDPTLEAKGQAACARLRQEIIDLLAESGDPDDGGGKDGLERAADRVQELRACVRVWKGTGEEKARGKFVDGLEALVEEERMKRDRRSVEVRRIEAENNARRSREEARPSGVRPTGARSAGEAGSGPGFLQRLREEIYME